MLALFVVARFDGDAQGKKMDIHYALPKDNPGEKEVNQGTLVVFNLDPAMRDDEIRAVFAEYGEVKVTCVRACDSPPHVELCVARAK